MNTRASVFLVLLFFAMSCQDDGFLDGFNRQELFAAPTSDELSAVIADWNARDLSPMDYNVVQTAEVTPSGTVLKIVSFKVEGNTEYGAILIPRSDHPMPVRMWIGGFAKDVTSYTVNLTFDDTALEDPFVFAAPALRGQALNIVVNGVEYTTPVSEGNQCEAFDGAADDAIAFLNIIEKYEANADCARVGVRGGSRGGTVALLMAERDRRVKAAACVAGPTNLLELTKKNENDATYQCQFLENLVSKASSIREIRHTLIASSPLFFAVSLPQTQGHFAENDVIVPVSQGKALEAQMVDLGLQDSFNMFVYEERDHSSIASNNDDLNRRIQELMSRL